MVLTITLHLYLQGTYRKMFLTIALHLYLHGIIPVVVFIVVIGTRRVTTWIVCVRKFTAASASAYHHSDNSHLCNIYNTMHQYIL